ncbi:MAG: hypothetical protein CSA54_03555 [Gammaproteobacteria bacterium]|nr:MAG: hypothetical protein CSA54_03555 [Gammaproteobacteria bacterium]
MTVRLSCTLPAGQATVWSLVGKSQTLVYITRGMLGFAGAADFPAQWQVGTRLSTRLLALGFIPLWTHHLSIDSIDPAACKIVSDEGGGIVSSWKHLIEIAAIDDKHCRYTDQVEISAGIFTPLVYAWAHIFYRYRQRRWRKLINQTKVCHVTDQ